MKNKNIRIIRRWLLFFMISLFFSGLTAIPLQTELAWLTEWFANGDPDHWFSRVYQGLLAINTQYRFMAYGYDWLAFAHFVLAILFIGPYRDPVRNKWVIEFGMIACVLIIPFALVAGHFRGIPLSWRLIDCAFGFIGIIPLTIVHNLICRLEAINERASRGGASVSPQVIRKLLRHTNPCNN